MADEMALSPDTSTEVVGRGADQPMTDDEAAESLNKLFAPPPKKKELPPKGPDGKFLKKDAPIPLTPADGSDDPDAEPVAEGEEPDEPKEPKAKKPAEPEDDDEPEDAPAPRLLKVKVDGMEVDVDEEELKKGYSRTSDYTRKTQAVAEERKAVNAEREQVRQLAQEFATKMAAVEEALQSLNPAEPDWNTLRQTLSPEDFTAQFAEWHMHSKRLERVKTERERVREYEESESARARQTRLAAEMEKLQDALPDLKDPEKGKVLRNDLTAYANSVGFSDDDLAGVEDHRALVLLDKARRWDEYQRNKPKLEAKVDRALATAVRPGSATPKPSGKKLDALQSKFDKSRSDADAAELLNTLLAPPRKAG